jgi:hypothetical protein
MGLHRKVACQQCEHFERCSQHTRLFVNYCGSRTKAVEAKIVRAVAECRARHGRLLQRSALTPVSKLKLLASH